jgi:hypothetical protein
MNMIKTKTISYSELSKQVRDMILFNNLSSVDDDWMYGFIVSPMLEERMYEDDKELAKEQDCKVEDLDETTSVYDYAESIYQTFIIDASSAMWLHNNTSEIISYSEKLDSFFFHVCHYGTSWSGVHTEIRDDDSDKATENDIWDVTKLANMTHG